MAVSTRLSARIPPWLAGLAVSLIWLVLMIKLVSWGALAIPDAIKPKITYPQFLAACQVVTLGAGVGLTVLFSREPRRELGLGKPKAAHLAHVALLSPLIFVVTSVVALRIALPYLLEELATRGHGTAREEAGQLGRQLQRAPLLFTLVWGALLAAAGEELLFRGAIWSAVERLVPVAKPRDAPPDSLLDALPAPSPWPGRIRRALPKIAATLVSAGLFGALHHDMKGSVGVVHVAATTCLGFASGFARSVTGGIAASILIHFVYNVTVIGNSRQWFGASDEPILNGIPDNLVYAAIAGVSAWAALALLSALARRAKEPSPAPE